MNIRITLFSLILALLVLFVSCGEKEKSSNTMAPIKTSVTADSLGYDVENKSSVYSTISIEAPIGLDDQSQKNFVIWLSATLSCERSMDKDAVKSLAHAYVATGAANLKNAFTKLDNELKKSPLQLWDVVTIKKVFDDDQYVTFIAEREYFGGELGVQTASIGYTFNRSDFTLADLINPDDEQYYVDLVTEELGKILVDDPENLPSALLEDAIDNTGQVKLPTHGAYLIDDTLVFQYQEYEIVPGKPCVKIPMKKK